MFLAWCWEEAVRDGVSVGVVESQDDSGYPSGQRCFQESLCVRGERERRLSSH